MDTERHNYSYFIGSAPATVLTHPDEVRYIQLLSGEQVLIDEDWYALASRFRWTRGRRGLVRQAREDGKPTGTWLARMVTFSNDRFTHINGDPLDCRACNIETKRRQNKPRQRRRAFIPFDTCLVVNGH